MDKYWDAAASMAEKADREIAKLRSERDKLRDALVCVNTLVIPIFTASCRLMVSGGVVQIRLSTSLTKP